MGIKHLRASAYRNNREEKTLTIIKEYPWLVVVEGYESGVSVLQALVQGGRGVR